MCLSNGKRARDPVATGNFVCFFFFMTTWLFDSQFDYPDDAHTFFYPKKKMIFIHFKRRLKLDAQMVKWTQSVRLTNSCWPAAAQVIRLVSLFTLQKGSAPCSSLLVPAATTIKALHKKPAKEIHNLVVLPDNLNTFVTGKVNILPPPHPPPWNPRRSKVRCVCSSGDHPERCPKHLTVFPEFLLFVLRPPLNEWNKAAIRSNKIPPRKMNGKFPVKCVDRFNFSWKNSKTKNRESSSQAAIMNDRRWHTCARESRTFCSPPPPSVPPPLRFHYLPALPHWPAPGVVSVKSDSRPLRINSSHVMAIICSLGWSTGADLLPMVHKRKMAFLTVVNSNDFH